MFQLPYPVRDANAGAGTSPLGNLPEWNLDDLYTGENAPELKRDLDWLEEACRKALESLRAGADPRESGWTRRVF